MDTAHLRAELVLEAGIAGKLLMKIRGGPEQDPNDRLIDLKLRPTFPPTS